MDSDVHYDRTWRPLEFWAAALSASRGLHALGEYDLEAVIGRALGYLTEAASPPVKAMSLYVLGKSFLLLRDHYPEWSEWVAWLALLSGEWAHLTGDEVHVHRSEALFTEYIQLLRDR